MEIAIICLVIVGIVSIVQTIIIMFLKSTIQHLKIRIDIMNGVNLMPKYKNPRPMPKKVDTSLLDQLEAGILESGQYWVYFNNEEWTVGDYEKELDSWYLQGHETSVENGWINKVESKVERNG